MRNPARKALHQFKMWKSWRDTAVLPKIPHSNCSKSVPNRPLWGRRGRFGILLEQLECGIFGRTAVFHLFRLGHLWDSSQDCSQNDSQNDSQSGPGNCSVVAHIAINPAGRATLLSKLSFYFPVRSSNTESSVSEVDCQGLHIALGGLTFS